MSDVSMNRMEEDCSSALRKIEDLKKQLSVKKNSKIAVVSGIGSPFIS
jgi:hypothetical protein